MRKFLAVLAMAGLFGFGVGVTGCSKPADKKPPVDKKEGGNAEKAPDGEKAPEPAPSEKKE